MILKFSCIGILQASRSLSWMASVPAIAGSRHGETRIKHAITVVSLSMLVSGLNAKGEIIMAASDQMVWQVNWRFSRLSGYYKAAGVGKYQPTDLVFTPKNADSQRMLSARAVTWRILPSCLSVVHQQPSNACTILLSNPLSNLWRKRRISIYGASDYPPVAESMRSKRSRLKSPIDDKATAFHIWRG